MHKHAKKEKKLKKKEAIYTKTGYDNFFIENGLPKPEVISFLLKSNENKIFFLFFLPPPTSLLPSNSNAEIDFLNEKKNKGFSKIRKKKKTIL